MSSTNRKAERREADFYATPHWTVHRLLEALELPAGVWFEPCAGEGDIVKAVNSKRQDVRWSLNELRKECAPSLRGLERIEQVRFCDILASHDLPQADVCITNPPFTIAQEILEHLAGRYEHLIFLQRVNWCAGPRADLFRKLKPSLYVLPNRPSFIGGSTDSIEYGWWVFDGKGQISILNNTPIKERSQKLLDRTALETVDKRSQKESEIGGEPAVETKRENEHEYENEYENEIQIQHYTEQGDDNMAGLPRDMAQQVGNARVTGSGNHIQHGNYVFLIKKWFFMLSPQNERCVIIEFAVVDAQKKTVHEGTRVITAEPNGIGSDCSEVVNWDGAGKLSAAGNSRAPVLGLFGFNENEIEANKVIETLDTCLSDAQPAAGMLIACSTAPREKRTKPGEFITARNWSCVARPGTGANAPDLVAARLAALKVSAPKAVSLARQHLGLSAFDADSVQTAAPTAPQTTAAPAPAAFGFGNAEPAFTLPPPPAPPVAAAPPAPPADPFAGWLPHPTAPGFRYSGQIVKSEADLMAGR